MLMVKQGKSSLVISEGWWVAETSYSLWDERGYGPDDQDWSNREERGYDLVGVSEVVKFVTTEHHDTGSDGWTRTRNLHQTHRLVAPDAFGVIEWRRLDDKLVDGLYFRSARQVHKGELGRLPEFPRPRRQMRVKDRVGHEWVNLLEVAELVGERWITLLRRFFPFTNDQSPVLMTQFGTREGMLGPHLGDPQRFFSIDEVPARDPAMVWITKGLAMTILYLHHFGYPTH